MKVKKLIKILKKLPKNEQIIIDENCNGSWFNPNIKFEHLKKRDRHHPDMPEKWIVMKIR